MLIKNLKLSFSKQEDGKVILCTENGAEVVLADFLLEGLDDKEKGLYLNLDYQPNSSVDDQKKLLNELLDEHTE